MAKFLTWIEKSPFFPSPRRRLSEPEAFTKGGDFEVNSMISPL